LGGLANRITGRTNKMKKVLLINIFILFIFYHRFLSLTTRRQKGKEQRSAL